jgi:hypothetical protein
MRILISYQQSYHVYSDALERAIRGLRPEVEVAACSLAEIGEQLKSFEPHLVVSSRPNTVDPGGRAAWYRLSRARRTVRSLPQRAALGEAQPTS